MTADNSNDTISQSETQGSAAKRGRKAPRKRSGTAGSASKRSRTAASRRSIGTSGQKTAAGASSARSRRSSRSSSGGASTIRSGIATGSARAAGIGARLLASAGRAMPLTTGGERMVQRLVDERPYVLGAIGLGIGAMIGMMLPGTFSSITRSTGRTRNRR